MSDSCCCLLQVMGYASYLVWQHGGWQANPLAFKLYAVQLAFNLLWPVTFFIKKRLGWAQLVNLGELGFQCLALPCVSCLLCTELSATVCVTCEHAFCCHCIGLLCINLRLCSCLQLA